MRVRFAALALVVFTSSAIAGPIWMRRSESLLPVNGEECIARAFRAFRAEGFSATQNLTNGVWGSKGDRWTLIVCNAAPKGQTWANIVSSALEGEADAHYRDHERVGARMGERSTDTVGGGQVTRMLTVELGPERNALVSWREGTSDPNSWVSVVPMGTPDGTHVGKWMYTKGARTGIYDSGTLAPGEYEARFYADDGYSKLLDRLRFTVGRPTRVPPSRMLNIEVTPQRTALVSWREGTSDPKSWVSVVPAGTSDGTHVGKWMYTKGAASGIYDSGPLASGEYEARFYADDGYGKLLDRVRFTVEAAPIGMSRRLSVEVTPQRSALVSWREGTSDPNSWVSVVPIGTGDGTHVGKWMYTKGARTGIYDSGALAPGEYEARFYADGGYEKLIDRVRFTVR